MSPFVDTVGHVCGLHRDYKIRFRNTKIPEIDVSLLYLLRRSGRDIVEHVRRALLVRRGRQKSEMKKVDQKISAALLLTMRTARKNYYLLWK